MGPRKRRAASSDESDAQEEPSSGSELSLSLHSDSQLHSSRSDEEEGQQEWVS